MSELRNIALAIGGLSLLAALTSGDRAGAAVPPAGVPDAMTPRAVYNIAAALAARYYPEVKPLMLTAMAQIESSYRPGAYRAEPQLNPPDASIGLMQTLYGTAKWLHDQMGYQAYAIGSGDDLMDPQTSIYFGGSYVDWLRRYRGIARSEQWIVESYNGGPGNSNEQTRRHWSKYQIAKAQLLAKGFA